MSSTPTHSVTQWIASLRSGDAEAVQKLWDRYRVKLMDAARRRLPPQAGAIADEEDVVQSVFFNLYRGAAAGRLDNVRNRDDLWWLLLAMAKQKTIDLLRRETSHKRGAGLVKRESSLNSEHDYSKGFTFDQLVGDEPTPEFLSMLEEQNAYLLGLLRDDKLRIVATSRIEGLTVQEIANTLAVSTRSVERKLQLIRNAWTKELLNAG